MSFWQITGTHDASCTCLHCHTHVAQTVDRFNNLLVSAFVTPGGARFLLLHDGKNDDTIRNFFGEIYELYVRVSAGCALPC